MEHIHRRIDTVNARKSVSVSVSVCVWICRVSMAVEIDGNMFYLCVFVLCSIFDSGKIQQMWKMVNKWLMLIRIYAKHIQRAYIIRTTINKFISALVITCNIIMHLNAHGKYRQSHGATHATNIYCMHWQ